MHWCLPAWFDVAIDARAQSFDTTFRRDVRYIVPVFQRRYAWERERQWEPLWGDVLEVVNSYLASTGGYLTPGSDDVPVHFLGAIVVKLMPFGAGQIELREVIDGQQRLTTIQLLIGASAAALRSLDATEQADVLADLIRNRPYLTRGNPAAAFKVWPTKHDREAFSCVMSGTTVTRAIERHRIVEAYRFFEQTVRDWGAALDDSERDLAFQALETVLRTQLHVVWIDLDERDNAQVIFETLNDRGAPLNPIDLVKNLVFQHEHSGDQAEDLYEQHWSWIEDDWWQKRVLLGRLERVRADVFLQHWLQMRRGEEVNSDYLFKAFSRVLESDETDVQQLVPEFADDARTYRSFFEQREGTRRRAFFDRLDVLNTTTPLPLVLYLFKQEPETLGVSQIDACLAAIEDYLVRRMLARRTAQAYNRLFTELVNEVRREPADALTIITRQLAAMDGASRQWPRDEELLPLLMESRAYGTGAIAGNRLLDVLWEVERSRLRTEKHEQLDRPPNLQIEHVMPRAWERHWPLPGGTDGDTTTQATERRAVAVNRLGNLTLVTDRLNPSMSNAAWDAKRPALLRHSLLAINQQLAEHYATGFDEDAIAERSRQLGLEILARWPGPVAWTANGDAPLRSAAAPAPGR